MFGAIRQPNGKYTIVEIYPFRRKTFYIKDKLKAMGARWNPETRRWEDLDEKFLGEIQAVKRMKIRLAPHSQVSDVSRDSYAFQHDIKDNQVQQLTMGDDYVWVNVEEVYGEG